ncbi:hypothetical protein [Pseudorhodoferax sp.]|uniref:hypothetical protein n=1 Tax=Pseudorhodoferax sp. TaxID=1993553 RepID=UPI002DD6B4BA|nr:hypothetical protein [Pseudorhodoferax sp.]
MATSETPPLALLMKSFSQVREQVLAFQAGLSELEDRQQAFLEKLLSGQGQARHATKVLEEAVALSQALALAQAAKARLLKAADAFDNGARGPKTPGAAMPGPADAGAMAMDAGAGQPLTLSVFLENYRPARDALQAEFAEQQALAQGAPTETARLAADALANELQAKLKELQDGKDLFVTKVGLLNGAQSELRDAVVRETIALNTALAQVVVNANRPRALLTIVTGFLGGAIQVFNGQVPPAAS